MKRSSELAVTGRVTLCALLGMFMTGVAIGAASEGESQVRRPVVPAPPTLEEARIIIEAAIAHARKLNQRATVVVVDETGNLIPAVTLLSVPPGNLPFRVLPVSLDPWAQDLVDRTGEIG